jgi:hypothetical protein
MAHLAAVVCVETAGAQHNVAVEQPPLPLAPAEHAALAGRAVIAGLVGEQAVVHQAADALRTEESGGEQARRDVMKGAQYAKLQTTRYQVRQPARSIQTKRRDVVQASLVPKLRSARPKGYPQSSMGRCRVGDPPKLPPAVPAPWTLFSTPQGTLPSAHSSPGPTCWRSTPRPADRSSWAARCSATARSRAGTGRPICRARHLRTGQRAGGRRFWLETRNRLQRKTVRRTHGSWVSKPLLPAKLQLPQMWQPSLGAVGA